MLLVKVKINSLDSLRITNIHIPISISQAFSAKKISIFMFQISKERKNRGKILHPDFVLLLVEP